MKKFEYYATRTGKKFNVAHVTNEDICREDIAHHLTKICRYGGALDLDQHYSVAQHSILLSDYARCELNNFDLAKYLLLHDASEAYLGDVVSGLKKHLLDYKKIETKIEKLIFDKYNIKVTKKIKKEAKELDTRILLDEAIKFAPHHYELFIQNCGRHITPLNIEIIGNNNLFEIKEKFLVRCAFFNIFDATTEEKIK